MTNPSEILKGSWHMTGEDVERFHRIKTELANRRESTKMVDIFRAGLLALEAELFSIQPK